MKLTKKVPLLTVDCVVIYKGSIILIKRKNEPFQDWLALPGGFVDIGETVEQACVRELFEETGIVINISKLKFVGIYSKPNRDPRRHTISIAFCSYLLKNFKFSAGDDAKSVHLIKDWKKETLAFDHSKIIKDTFKKYLNQKFIS